MTAITEDEREALADLIESSRTPMGGTLLGSRPQFEAIADAILAAGFRRQVPSTPEAEWEYATPFDQEDEDGNPTRLWIQVNPATTKHPVYRKPKGDWEPVPPTEGES